MKSLSSLPNGFLNTWYREQSDEVKANVRTALGVFVQSKINSGKYLIFQKEKAL